MASTEGKLLVLGEILRFESKPFKVAHLTNLTGLTRQVVHYHVRQFEEKEYIVKHDKFYVLHDKEGLHEELREMAHKRHRADLLSDVTFTDPAFTNNVVKFMKRYYALEDFIKETDPATAERWSPLLDEVRKLLKERCEGTIKNVTMFQRYLATRMRDQSPSTARKELLLMEEKEFDDLFKEVIPELTPHEFELLQGVVREYRYAAE